MEKKNIDWNNLGFGYSKTDYRFVARYQDGRWEEGKLTGENTLCLNEAAGVLHYSQSCFEGLKAYTTKEGHVVMFRPDLNAQRMESSCNRLMMPPFPKDLFVKACIDVAKANEAYVPPFGSGASLYIRPVMYATGDVLGVSPATEYEFRIFASPVGPYFKGGVKPIKTVISDYDRAAPHGTGSVKAGLNYAMSLYAGYQAKRAGYNECIYLDSKTRQKIEESGGANFIGVTKDGKLLTPKSDTILPSITRRSLMQIAKDYLGMETEETDIYIDKVGELTECGLCGTAAVISPIGSIECNGKLVFEMADQSQIGPVLKKLYDTLLGIQHGELKAPEGWICQVL